RALAARLAWPQATSDACGRTAYAGANCLTARMPRRAAETRARQRPRHKRPWPDVEAMAPRSRLRGRAPDRAAAAGCHDGTWVRGVHWFLTRPGVDGGKGCLDRARGVVAVLRAMPAPLHATDEAFLSPRRPGALLTIRREALAPRAPLDWHPSAERSTRRVISSSRPATPSRVGSGSERVAFGGSREGHARPAKPARHNL